MDFNSLAFLGFFCGIAVLTYCFPRRAKPYFLLLASYAFYLYKPENARMVGLLVSATVITYGCGLALDYLKGKWARLLCLWASLLFCGGILFYFKYFNFFTQAWHDLVALFGGTVKVSELNLIAPLGLSYFTFQSLGYVIDVYLHRIKPVRNPAKYALFVSFFPCIFTGPIERAEHLIPQFDHPHKFNYARMSGGAFRMLWGYFKKMVLADTIAAFVSTVYASPEKSLGPYLIIASLLFSYQIYLDFSGCCDIAIGGACVLGFDLLENFNRPFAARTYTELWNRWHISLTSWFRDYIFTPLSFFNRGLPGFWGKLQGWFNVFIIFPISGLWHGPSWNYVIWGAFNGLFLVFGKATAKKRRRRNKKNPLYKSDRIKGFIQRTCVYLLFTFCIVFFAAALNGTSALTVFSGMFSGWAGFTVSGFVQGLASRSLPLSTIGLLLLGCTFVELVEWRGPVYKWIRRQCFVVRWVVYYVLSMAILFFGVFGKSMFIYQQY